mgnify:CR=1 FL=1|tara:strand:+ start:243 stop:545 length:303 start_codon:yes stop_codon:yes gene_type:complete
MLIDNPLMINGKVDELLARVVEEHVGNLVVEKGMTMDTVRALLKRQMVVAGDDTFVRMKTMEQLGLLDSVGESFEGFQIAVEKLKTIQGEKHAILRGDMY